MGNLIRNAFQHTQQGKIAKIQTGNMVTIINEYDHVDDSLYSNELGFGLGLQLTSQLTEKLGWVYSKTNDNKKYQVMISFSSKVDELNR